MTINFHPSRWDRVKKVYADFWSGRTDRLVYGVAIKEHPFKGDASVPLLAQNNCHDFSIPPEKVAERIVAELAQYEFYGDAFPVYGMEAFGPGIAAAFLGARVDNSTGGMWFFPPGNLDIEKFEFKYDPDNPWLKRIKSICTAINDRMGGYAIVGIPDLGGITDILASFFHGEELLLALYDYPEHVKRLTKQLDDLFQQFHDEFHPLCAAEDGGNSNWMHLYSQKTSYTIQCDFSYMIGPEMFGEFVMPSLVTHCERLEDVIYHLDGIGELPHLDQILSIEKLAAIQWVPGAGAPEPDYPEYLDLYRKILAAGKQVQIQHCAPEILANIVDNVGGKGIYHPPHYCEPDKKDEMLRYLDRFGIER